MCAIYIYLVIGVKCCKTWDIHPVLKKHVFSFQTLVLSYELFISLPFFSHFPDNHQSYQICPQLSDETVILCVQSMLDVFTARGRPPWTLLGMPHLRKRGMGILSTRQGEVCMVAPPLLDVQTKTLIFFIRMSLDYWPCNDFSRLAHPSSTLYCSLLDSHWIIQDVMIFQSWPIPHKLCIVNHQGWSSFLHQFKLKRWCFFISLSLVLRCPH